MEVIGETGVVSMASRESNGGDVTFVATRRNGRALCLKGFFYHINKSVDERSYWKCRTKGCKATVVTINDVISSSSGQHSHNPNDTRVATAADTNQMIPNMTNKLSPNPISITYLASIGLIKPRVTDISGDGLSRKKLKTQFNSNLSHNYVDNNNEISIKNEWIGDQKDAEEVDAVNSFDDQMIVPNVEIEVDETGQVMLEDIHDKHIDSQSLSQSNANQLMPNSSDIKPNSIYFANNYTNIKYFDIEMNNLFSVVRQSGFNSLDIDQISNGWQLWKNRYLELKRAKSRAKPLTSTNGCNDDKGDDNMTLKLQIMESAKQNAERELHRVQVRLKESQSNVTSLRALLKRNVLNTSNNQCLALINEINHLKRKVSAQVESHQSNLNQVKRLLCLDDMDLRAEFEGLAQERDDALKDNFDLRQQIIVLKNKLSLRENNLLTQ